jgi:hypothetical protein
VLDAGGLGDDAERGGALLAALATLDEVAAQDESDGIAIVGVGELSRARSVRNEPQCASRLRAYVPEDACLHASTTFRLRLRFHP